jgi:hypothetical protein
MTNKDNNASKPPTMLTLRPTMEQREEARRREKARRVTNNDDNNASIPPMMMTMTMTKMTTSCQFFTHFYWLFYPLSGWWSQ